MHHAKHILESPTMHACTGPRRNTTDWPERKGYVHEVLALKLLLDRQHQSFGESMRDK